MLVLGLGFAQHRLFFVELPPLRVDHHEHVPEGAGVALVEVEEGCHDGHLRGRVSVSVRVRVMARVRILV